MCYIVLYSQHRCFSKIIRGPVFVCYIAASYAIICYVAPVYAIIAYIAQGTAIIASIAFIAAETMTAMEPI